MSDSLANREKGQFPISIATSLAMESLAGIHPNILNVVNLPIKDVSTILINIRTIIRNIHGALPTEASKALKAKELIDTLLAEMTIIEATVNKLSEGMVNVVFYASTYGSLARKYPQAILRSITTDLQIQYTHLERDTIIKLLENPLTFDIRRYDTEITDRFTDVLIITHLCIDLLSKSQFNRLRLLETHTGIIKNHLQWNTKLTKGKDLIRIPFNRFTLQVFGDNGHLFSQMDHRTRAAVLNMAEADQWTTASTKDRIVASIRKLDDPSTRMTLLALL